tara:strand:+ start:385 stop:687 length:303 start_codon:yes stop_codon:yes gene_type:complete
MAQCPNCNNNLNSISIYKSFLSYKGYSNIECKSCGTLIVHSAKNRLYGGLVAAISILIACLYFNFKDPSVENVLLGIALAAVALLLGSFLIIPLLQFEKD